MQEAIQANDDSLADDVAMDDVRNVVVDEISRHVVSKLNGRSDLGGEIYDEN